ncbi:DUF3617 domain-containing protein [Croceicoccus sediminis]|uniref:DUF3617 domain-containing protein n=1 Tax=Croceicoccus sediminis TaxID=2571150 RepID=UPI00118400E6|nr:DUF3617 domain-containing protein [Croceicoccus sediminis]
MRIRPLSRLAILCLAPLALAACGSDESAEQADEASVASGEDTLTAPGGMSEDAIAAEMKKAIRPKPGQYTSTAELIELDVPGVPAAQAKQMKDMMGSSLARTTSRCLTPDEAEKGFEELAKAQQEGCTVDSFKVDGSKFVGKMTCENPDASGTMTMSGTGTETSSDMEMAMDMTSPNLPGGRMAMKMHVTSKRTGDCEG